MIRVVFDNGEIIECEHISEIYVEEIDIEKITIIGRIPKGENDGIDS
jgi:hypothetical protein